MRRLLINAAFFAIVVSSANVEAGETPAPTQKTRPHVHWDPAWPHANAWDYTIGTTAAVTAAAEVSVLQTTQAPLQWTNPILFDTDVRSAMRLPDANGRSVIDATSWGLLITQLAYPVLVDVPYAWARYGFPVARDLFWQSATTLFLATAIDLALRDLAGRARPVVYDCISNGGAHCVDNPEAVRSFPGGHFLTGTAASVLTCTQHLYMRLYGHGWDALACGMTLASDVAVGAMRLMADSHWITDELAGAAIGALIGWGVPYVMHFRWHTPRDAQTTGSMIVPIPLAFANGAGLGVAVIQ